MIYHKLSFESSLLEAAAEEREWVERALGSYLRLDIPSFLPEVMLAVAGTDVETAYILWTDPGKADTVSYLPDELSGITGDASACSSSCNAYEDL